jgi:hypothetical protein
MSLWQNLKDRTLGAAGAGGSPAYETGSAAPATTAGANDPARVVIFSDRQAEILLDNTSITEAGKALLFRSDPPTVGELLTAYNLGDIDDQPLRLARITVPADQAGAVERFDALNPKLAAIADSNEEPAVNTTGVSFSIEIPKGKKHRVWISQPMFEGDDPDDAAFDNLLELSVSVSAASITVNSKDVTTIVYTTIWRELVKNKSTVDEVPENLFRVYINVETFAP